MGAWFKRKPQWGEEGWKPDFSEGPPYHGYPPDIFGPAGRAEAERRHRVVMDRVFAFTMTCLVLSIVLTVANAAYRIWYATGGG